MMGKLQSKHADCIFVNADLNKALEDNIWKKKTGFNLANYNMDETLSELSICLEEKSESSPLRVELPPSKLDTETSKVLRLDHIGIRRAGRHSGKGGKDKNKLNIEEFECGVQFEGSETAKQEWSFTLYDFDGHGRITKEDLASLLKALYDAVGSSIKLPPNGAKTLKLRLSVGQDASGGLATFPQGPVQQHADPQGHSNNTTTTAAANNNNIATSNNASNNFNNKKNNALAAGATQTSSQAAAARATERSRNTARAPKNKVREFSKLNNLTASSRRGEPHSHTGGKPQQQQHQQLVVKRTNESRGRQQQQQTASRVASLLPPPSCPQQVAPPPSLCSGNRDSAYLPLAGLLSDLGPTAEVTAPTLTETSPLQAGQAPPPPPPAPATAGTGVPLSGDQSQEQTCTELAEHQRLAEMIQENMERNRVRQQIRRQNETRAEGRHPRYYHHHHHLHHNHRRRPHRTTSNTRCPATGKGSDLPTAAVNGVAEEDLGDSLGVERLTGGVERLSGGVKTDQAAPSHRCGGGVDICSGDKEEKKCRLIGGAVDGGGGEDDDDDDDTGSGGRCAGGCQLNGDTVGGLDKGGHKGVRRALPFRGKDRRRRKGGGVQGDRVGGAEEDTPTKPEGPRAEESQDRRNYYLDLAGVENTSSRFQSSYRSNLARAGCSRRGHRGHHRSRSHDLATAHAPAAADDAELTKHEASAAAATRGVDVNHCSVPCSNSKDGPHTSESKCVCHPATTTAGNHRGSLLFSAVTVGLSLATELPLKSDSSARRKDLHTTTAGNSVVRMLTTCSGSQAEKENQENQPNSNASHHHYHYHHNQQQQQQQQQQHPVVLQTAHCHGRSKSHDPHDLCGDGEGHARRGKRTQHQQKQQHHQQQQQQQHQHHEEQAHHPSCRANSALASSLLRSSLTTSSEKSPLLASLNTTSSNDTATTKTFTVTHDSVTTDHPARGRRFRPLSLPSHVPACVSPHHHRRHRHRDKDHSQAMRQVAQWIAREQHAWDHEAGTGVAGGQILVQRHEHHHIHEHHHHHHYHHYHET